MNKKIGEFVIKKRKENHLRQEDLALYAGVSTKFIIDLEKGKEALKTDKINDVLSLFGYELGPVRMEKKDEES